MFLSLHANQRFKEVVSLKLVAYQVLVRNERQRLQRKCRLYALFNIIVNMNDLKEKKKYIVAS